MRKFLVFAFLLFTTAVFAGQPSKTFTIPVETRPAGVLILPPTGINQWDGFKAVFSLPNDTSFHLMITIELANDCIVYKNIGTYLFGGGPPPTKAPWGFSLFGLKAPGNTCVKGTIQQDKEGAWGATFTTIK